MNVETIVVKNENAQAPITARSINYLKVGTTTEAAGVLHSLHASSGTPGAWSPGTPGLSGRATDGTTSADNGCLKFPDATTGVNYLTNFLPTGTTASTQFLVDFLWVNSGIAVTTTTAQTIDSVALPARDREGSTAGLGVMAGILVTTATTNAGAITNTTISYTNSEGVSGRTGGIASFPATAVKGTLVAFNLQAGDEGVQSIQSVTLGTSYGGGAISLVMFRIVAGAPCLIANAGGQIQTAQGVPGINVRLFNGACLIPVIYPLERLQLQFSGC